MFYFLHKGLPKEILEANEKAVSLSEIVIVVFDNIGTGTAIEYQRAFLLNKKIIGFKKNRKYLGKMMDGAWDRIPNHLKAKDINELNRILDKIVERKFNKNAEKIIK